jgi:type I restriction enzyme, S subunit
MLMKAECLLENFDRIAESPGSIAHLRRFILDLAVRGKLVEQDPNDEPASKLLKRIQIEKQKLVNEGKIKRDVILPPIDYTESPFLLPIGWDWARFPELGIFGRGKSKHRPRNDPSLFEDGTHFFVQTGDIARSNGVINTYTSKYNDVGLAQSHKWTKGTLCITIAANIADSGILSFDACFPDSVVGFIPASIFPEARYFEYFIRTAKANLLEYAPATAQKNINLSILNAVLIPLPPLAEQHRIVAKVDELMGLCDRLEAAQKDRESQRDRLVASSLHHLNQATAPAEFRDRAQFYFDRLPKLTTRSEHIKQLRQTILNLAVCGKLVPQYPNDEPASELLDRIQFEKLRSEKAGLLRKDKMVWEGLSKEVPYTLPSEWVWARIQNVFEISRGGSPRPAGDPLYFGGSIPWITVREITKDNGKYLLKTESGLTEEGSTKSRFINPGDLLLTNSGATLGVPKISKIRGCMNDGVVVLRLFHTENINDFAFLYLNSQTQAFRQINQGIGQPNLNTPIIAGWFFPLPPLAEQHRIVAKVDELMGLCDRLEAQIDITETDSRRLLESLLHQARSNAA